MSPRLALAAALFLGTSTVALADYLGQMDYVEGSAYLFVPQMGQWQPIGPGTPITSGNSLSTGPQSQAEIQLGLATLRLGQQSQIDVIRLDPSAVQIQVDQGATALYLQGQPPPGGLVVVTPLGQALLMRPGVYHIDVAFAPPGTRPGYAEIGVLDGDAQVMAGPGMMRLLPGQKAVFAGQPTTLSLVQVSPSPMDDWSPHHWHHDVIVVPSFQEHDRERHDVIVAPSFHEHDRERHDVIVAPPMERRREEHRPEALSPHPAPQAGAIEAGRPAAGQPPHTAPQQPVPAAAAPSHPQQPAPAAAAQPPHAAPPHPQPAPPAAAAQPPHAAPPAKGAHEDKDKDKREHK